MIAVAIFGAVCAVGMIVVVAYCFIEGMAQQRELDAASDEFKRDLDEMTRRFRESLK